jgi:N-acetylmuramoyl-L-alanine amidase
MLSAKPILGGVLLAGSLVLSASAPAVTGAAAAGPGPAAGPAPVAGPARVASGSGPVAGSAAGSGVASGSGPVAAANAGAAVPAAVAPSHDGQGFWVASTDGASYGDASGDPLTAPVVGIARTASGSGYWELGADGGVFSFGDASFYGSTGGIHLVQPALQMVATPSGHGYWFVARDGGVFSFGDASFYGSTGGVRLVQPVVGMAAFPGGGGYWLVARDGGIFSFGAARFQGSLGGVHLAEPIVAMAPTANGGGYWLVARDGGVFSFGDAQFHGSLGGTTLPAPVIGMVATGDGGGYWLVLGDGQVRAFGDAADVATAPVPSVGFSLVGEVIGLDPGHNGGNGSDPGYIDQPVWNGTGFETCDTTGTATDSGYTEAAFNFDVATRLAAILRSYGATVVMTRTSNSGVGPCITTRAAIIDGARADAALDIHADGGPPGGRGETILEPVPVGPNDAVIGPSDQLAVMVRDAFTAATGEPDSDYYGVDGLQPRSDLAGLNLTTVPKVLIECANMRNATDAALIEDPGWRQEAATGLARALSQFLIGFQ